MVGELDNRLINLRIKMQEFIKLIQFLRYLCRNLYSKFLYEKSKYT